MTFKACPSNTYKSLIHILTLIFLARTIEATRPSPPVVLGPQCSRIYGRPTYLDCTDALQAIESDRRLYDPLNIEWISPGPPFTAQRGVIPLQTPKTWSSKNCFITVYVLPGASSNGRSDVAPMGSIQATAQALVSSCVQRVSTGGKMNMGLENKVGVYIYGSTSEYHQHFRTIIRGSPVNKPLFNLGGTFIQRSGPRGATKTLQYYCEGDACQDSVGFDCTAKNVERTPTMFGVDERLWENLYICMPS
ncbi:MAG: hypothetical protein M1827_001170 [Pycnora praestabilis]|nr:MAG: hypothetical protein M1827_001170 [Pycnora praestabilis]